MFNLDTALASWRHALKNERALSPEDLDELEQHIRDQVQWLIHDGLDQEAAYRQAIQEMGALPRIQQAYKEVLWRKKAHRNEMWDEVRWHLGMAKNYAKVALRNLIRYPVFSLVNLLGLSIGLTAFILITLFVRYEMSYDQFFSQSDRLYRVVKEDPGNFYQQNNRYALTPAPLVSTLQTEIPGIEEAAQISSVSALLSTDSESVIESGVFATSAFFELFDYALLAGTDGNLLSLPNAIVLTEPLANRIFGSTPVVGKQLSMTLYGEVHELVVTGVIKEPPLNSHLAFEYVVSMSSDSDWVEFQTDWNNNDWYTYFLATRGAEADVITTAIDLAAKSQLAKLSWFQADPSRISNFEIQPVPSIHLRSNVNFEIGRTGNLRQLLLIVAIAFFILLIACINYMNMATARAATRAREIGIRQASGASSHHLIQQFLGESFIVTSIAMASALCLVVFLWPSFTTLVNRAIPVSELWNRSTILVLLAILLAVGFVAGSYPAFRLSRATPTRLIRGTAGSGPSTSRFRNTLVVAQFAIGIILVTGTLAINQQLSFMSSQDTGISREQIVAIPTRDRSLRGQYGTIYNELERISTVEKASGSFSLPTNITPESGTNDFEGSREGQRVSAFNTSIGFGWIELLGLEMSEGRSFAEDFPADEGSGLIINESAKKAFGWDTAVGKQLHFGSRGDVVVGVVEDFHFHSLHQQIAPLILYLAPERPAHILIKVNSNQMRETLDQIEAVMTRFSPAFPFEANFLDDSYQLMYDTEQRLNRLVQAAAILAMIIAGMGLFALSTFMAEQKQREIGIRKALGAGERDIVFQLSREFLVLVGLAILLAIPLAWIGVNMWLNTFAYRIPFGIGSVLVAGLVALALASVTVSYQAIRSARLNPVDALRQS